MSYFCHLKSVLPENHGFEMLILKMVKRDPESRATLKEIIEYLKLIRYILPIHVRLLSFIHPVSVANVYFASLYFYYNSCY